MKSEHEDIKRAQAELKIGAPQPPATLGELKAWAAENGFLGGLLRDIGHWYDKRAPGDREVERERERER
jgi:hypothetical protein